MLPQDDWNGMILHLYRQIDSSVFPVNFLKAENGDGRKTYTAFGNFDRLCFTPVPRFVDYLKRSGSAYQWIGGRKDIMLYPITGPATSDRHFIFTQTEDDDQAVLAMREESRRRFLIITMLYVSDKAKAMVDPYSVLLKKCKEHIGKIVEKYNQLSGASDNNRVIFDVFGTFNSAEIGIIWGANQYTDVQYIVDQIRYLSLSVEGNQDSEPMFTSSYTIVTVYNGGGAEPLQIDTIKGGALIQLASATVRNSDEVPDKKASTAYLVGLKEMAEAQDSNITFDIDSCAGEYDFILNTRPPQLGLLTKVDDLSVGGLYVKNESFGKFFSSSTTSLFYDEEADISDSVRNFDWKTLLKIPIEAKNTVPNISEEWKQPRELLLGKSAYRSYKEKLSRSVTSVSSLCTNLELLYGDYIRAVNTTPDRQWARDLDLQVTTAFNVLEAFCDPENENRIYIDRAYVESSEGVLQRLRQQIHHITEAGKFSFEEPCLHTESTIEYDLLFHMYYGAVKDILACIYDRNKGATQAKQSKLIPLIQFQPTPIITSALYHDKEEIQDRLIDITIPYDAWGEPNIFIAYLIHELYHYAAPYNRSKRNDFFAKLIITELVANAVQNLLEQYYKENVNLLQDKMEVEDRDRAIPYITANLRPLLLTAIGDKDIAQHIILDAANNSSDTEDDYQRNLLKLVSEGDPSWSVFFEALAAWYSGDDGYNTYEYNFEGFLLAALDKVCNTLDQKFSCENAGNTTNVVFKNAVELYKIMKADILLAKTENRGMLLLEHVRGVGVEWIPQLCQSLREMFPDYAMVKLSGLGASEYLLLFAALQEKLYNTPAIIREDTALTLRIGYILDQLIGCKEKSAEARMQAFQCTKEDFVKLYSAYIRLCNWSDTSGQQAEGCIRTNAEKWFALFSEKLADYYSQYSCYQNLLNEMTSAVFEPLCESKHRVRLQEVANTFYQSLRENDAQKLFKSNMDAVWAFQHQKFLSELIVTEEAIISPSSTTVTAYNLLLNNRRTDVLRLVNCAEDLQKEFVTIARKLEEVHESVFGTKLPKNGLWYRGSQNSSFDILPSAMVHFLDQENLKTSNGEKGKNAAGMLWQFQKDLLDRFKYQADGANEFLNSASYTMPDYLAIMQHYQQYTCYLDWSEDAFSSLFFALESYIMGEELKHENANVSLYIMDPMLYNRARKMMVKKFLPKRSILRLCDKSSAWLAQQNHALDKEVDGHIPNLSAKHNPEKYGMFTMDLPKNFDYKGSDSYHLCSCEAKVATLAELHEEMINLPIAVHTSRLNPRIRTQSGQFVAYSPFALPVYSVLHDDKDDPTKNEIRAYRYSYLSLLKIQQYFLDTFPDEHPFMYDLQISKDAKKGVAEYLRKSGINRYRIYPELTYLKL